MMVMRTYSVKGWTVPGAGYWPTTYPMSGLLLSLVREQVIVTSVTPNPLSEASASASVMGSVTKSGIVKPSGPFEMYSRTTIPDAMSEFSPGEVETTKPTGTTSEKTFLLTRTLSPRPSRSVVASSTLSP